MDTISYNIFVDYIIYPGDTHTYIYIYYDIYILYTYLYIFIPFISPIQLSPTVRPTRSKKRSPEVETFRVSSKPLDRRHTGNPGTVGAAMTKGILGVAAAIFQPSI